MCDGFNGSYFEISPNISLKSSCLLFFTAGCKCDGFKSSYTCGCGQPYNTHHMIVETKEERQARGHPIGHDVPYQAMGGLTGFSSLMEGYMRLDPSGIGKI